jgi:hypothetical protein
MSVRYEDRPRLKEKQIAALDKGLKRAEAITGTSLATWDIVFREETRPGRGHDLIAWTGDSDYVVTQYLDPYGNGPLVVCTIDVIHNDSDEDHFNEYGVCECREGEQP